MIFIGVKFYALQTVFCPIQKHKQNNRAVSLPHLHDFLDVYSTPFIKKKKTRTRLKSRGDEAEKLT